ncbi:MAG: LptE family protein [Deltaproteobacteria bacterium]|nr:LptE family protein [Deltaproteobacteria bacterium]
MEKKNRIEQRGNGGKSFTDSPIHRFSHSLLLLFALHCSLLAALAGCGYHIAGKGGSMPGSVAIISIPFFKNQVRKPDVETIITTALVDEFVKSGIVKVVDENAEAILNGAVTGYNLTPVSFNSTDVIQEYRLTIKIEIELVRSSDGKILWEDKNITDYEDFKVSAADINTTKAAELDIVKKMARDTARLIKERMLEQF